jgi:hypothetical protein
MRDKRLIDLGPGDRSGVQAMTWDYGANLRCLWIDGTDHWHDVVHHILPGVRRRELLWAKKLADAVFDPAINEYRVGGHSLGGCLAALVAEDLRERGVFVHCVVFGAKRTFRGNDKCVSVVHVGDLIPALPPWRPPYWESRYFGERASFWDAHQPKAYYDQMKIFGF